ncbi:hypothetical protein COBT_000857 [Conglomerata obtusa]
MRSWNYENVIGLSLPFLERNIAKVNSRYNLTYENKNCSVMIMDSIKFESDIMNKYQTKKLEIILICHLENKNYKLVPQRFIRKLMMYKNDFYFDHKIIIRNKTCFDDLKIFMIVLSDGKPFLHILGEINMCIELKESVKLKKDADSYINAEIYEFVNNGFFTKNTDEFAKLNFKIYTLKKIDEMHYCYFTKKNTVQNYYECKYENNLYKIESYRCIFCLKRFSSLEILNTHVNCIHLYYSTNIEKEKYLCITKKDEDDVNNSSYNGVCILQNDNLLFLENTKLDKSIIKIPLLFININIKRGKKYKKYNLIREKIVPQIMETKIRNIVGDDWLEIMIEKRLNDMVTVDDDDKSLMKKWNIMIFRENVQPNYHTMPRYVNKFLIEQKISEKNIELLVMFYEKGIISQNDAISILKNVCKKFDLL